MKLQVEAQTSVLAHSHFDGSMHSPRAVSGTIALLFMAATFATSIPAQEYDCKPTPFPPWVQYDCRQEPPNCKSQDTFVGAFSISDRRAIVREVVLFHNGVPVAMTGKTSPSRATVLESVLASRGAYDPAEDQLYFYQSESELVIEPEDRIRMCLMLEPSSSAPAGERRVAWATSLARILDNKVPATVMGGIQISIAGQGTTNNGRVSLATIGTDDRRDPGFHVVANTGQTPVAAITWDLERHHGLRWNFDGPGSFQSKRKPVVLRTSLHGLQVDHIRWAFDEHYPKPKRLTAYFDPPLAPNASFRFGAATESPRGDNSSGGEFGVYPPVRASVALVDGTTMRIDYVQRADDWSQNEETASGGLRLPHPPSPGRAARDNTVHFFDAEPGARLSLALGYLRGQYAVSLDCPGFLLDISKPLFVPEVVADRNGDGTFVVYIPLRMQGRSLWLQVYDRSNCAKSPPRVHRFF